MSKNVQFVIKLYIGLSQLTVTIIFAINASCNHCLSTKNVHYAVVKLPKRLRISSFMKRLSNRCKAVR